MNIKKAKEEIKNTVQAYLKKDVNGEYVIPTIRQRPVLLMGPPGIGKTQIMEQIARECRIGLVAYTITHHTRQSAVGLPFIREEEFDGRKYSITEYTMSEIISSVYRKIRDSGLKEGILFIDEINCVSETLAPTMLQFLQCKTFGNQKVPEGWLIVAAGNPPEYNKSVREFDMVTLDRVRKMDVEADFEVWKEYARVNHVERAILSYLELRPQNFYRVEADVDGMQFVTARGWEDLSCLYKVYRDMGLKVDEEIIYEFIQHHEIAKDIAAYFDLYEKYQDDYGVQDILEGNPSAEAYQHALKASFDERLSVVNLLISGLDVRFHQVHREHVITDKWYEFLREYNKALKDKTTEENCYVQKLEELKQQFEAGKKADFYTKDESKIYECLINKLRDYAVTDESDASASFARSREGFDKQREQLESSESLASDSLEHAFDFMESAFPDGQEMVVFVTELTMSKEAVMFLAENDCERYLQYNSQLMVGTRKAELLSMLDKDDICGNEHMRDF